jgi:pimeloyl-ACP methyl ester carboxylesterase
MDALEIGMLAVRGGRRHYEVDQQVEVHADDAYSLLDHVSAADEPVCVFGSFGGGLVALELMVRHRDRIRTAVAHEPPVMPVLPDAADHLRFFDGVYEVFRREGVASALEKLSAVFCGRAAPRLPVAVAARSGATDRDTTCES